MSEKESRQPSNIAWVILAGALGMVAINGQKSSTDDAASATQNGSKEERTEGSQPIASGGGPLDPLDDFFALDSRRKQPFTDRAHLTNRDRELALINQYKREYLIVTVPDPMDSQFGYWFDELMDSIQRALEMQDYVIDRAWLPWELDKRKPVRTKITTDWRELSALVSPFRGGKNGEDSTSVREENPGTLLFRAKSANPNFLGALRIVFLVGENPTSGIDKRALTRAIELIGQDQPARGPLPHAGLPTAEPGARAIPQTSETASPSPDRGELSRAPSAFQIERGTPPARLPFTIRIVGPCFTGSQTSLRMVLHDQIHNHITFNVISGEATGVTREDFCTHDHHRITFQATVNPTSKVLTAILHYLEYRDQSRSDDGNLKISPNWLSSVALLKESNTGFGQKPFGDEGKKSHITNDLKAADDLANDSKAARVLELRFPLHMAWLRSRYEEARRRRDEKLNLPDSDSLLRRLGNKIPDQDSISLQDAETTTSANGEVLQNILSIIRRQQVRYVGIIATDPRDQIMLASAIRDNCPAVQIFLIGSDRLLTLPEYSNSLKGTIIGSTYPLAPTNQFRTKLDKQLRLFFPSEWAQGYYNAILAQIGGEDHLIGYHPPLLSAVTNAQAIQYRRPPVWISMIGQNGDLVPLQFFTAPGDEEVQQYVWTPEELPERQQLMSQIPSSFPNSAILPLVLIGVLCLLVLYYALRAPTSRLFWPTGQGESPGQMVSTNTNSTTATPMDTTSAPLGTMNGTPLTSNAGADSGMSEHTDSATISAADQGTTPTPTVVPNSSTNSISAPEDSTSDSGTINGAPLTSNVGTVSTGSVSGMSEHIDSSTISAAGQSTASNPTEDIIVSAVKLTAPEDTAKGSDLTTSPTTTSNAGAESTDSTPVVSVGASSGAISAAGQETTTRPSAATKKNTSSAPEDAANDWGFWMDLLHRAICLIALIFLLVPLIELCWIKNSATPWEGFSAFVKKTSLTLAPVSILCLLVLALFTPVVREWLARPQASRGREPWVYWLGYVLGGLLVFGVLVCVWYYAYLGDGLDSWKALFFDRALNVTTGVSPLLPLALLSATFFFWAFFQLKKSHLADRFSMPCPYPTGSDAAGGFKGIRDMDKKLRDEFSASRELISKSPGAVGLAVVVILGVVAIWVYRLSLFLVPTPEGSGWDKVFFLGFVLGYILIALNLIRFLLFWKRLKKLLHEIALVRMMHAFERLPHKVAVVFGGYFSTRRPRLSQLRIPHHQLGLLLIETDRLVDKLTDRQDKGRLSELQLIQKGLDDFKEKDFCSQSESDTEEKIMGELSKRFGEMTDSLLQLLPECWSKHSFQEAFGSDALEERLDKGREKPHKDEPDSGSAETGTGVFQRWVQQAENFIAMQVVIYLSQFLIQVRNLAWSMVVCGPLLLLGATSYPFQPERLILVLLLALIGASIAGILFVLVRINQDEVVSRIMRTTPNKFQFDWGFLSSFFTYIVPMGTVVALQLFGAFRFLLEPLVRLVR